MIVVSDNSPLQYLVLIGCIEVLPALYGQVLTTPQVIAELGDVKTPDAVRVWAANIPSWIGVESPLKIDYVGVIDLGEASAISLAKERHADLVLIDERAGSETARHAGMKVIGTLGVLIEAGVEGLVDFDAAINLLTTQTSFYATPSLIDAARRIFLQRQQNRP